MKRSFVIMLIALVVGISGVSALESGFGVRGVLGTNWMSGNDWDEWKDYLEEDSGSSAESRTRFAFGAGVFIDFKMSDRLALGVEALYSELGGKMEVSDYKWTEEVTFKAIQVPITLKFAPINTQLSCVYIFAGPNLFLILDDVDDVFKQVGYDKPSYSYSPENDFVFGLVGGAGYERKLGSGAIILDARYARILGEVLDEEVYYNSILIGLGYKYVLTK